MSEKPSELSFADFKDSFSYGSRTDLNFKFLKSLSTSQAADFIQELLHQLGDSMDDGRVDRLTDLVFTWQARAYQAAKTPWTYDEGPFAPLGKSVRTARLGLLTSSGHFVAGDDPTPFGIQDMSQADAAARVDDFLKAEPTLSAIPFTTPRQNLRVRHPGYDIRSAQADPSVVLPLEEMMRSAEQGDIGQLPGQAYSFVGACAQTRLLRHSGPAWVDRFRQDGVDGMILVPV